MRPPLGGTKPAIRLSNVVFPLPDGPSATSNCRGPRLREMSVRTGPVVPG
ncbi:hypothetical protein D187_003188 [Cystobacter fuscus DSM 2262]|uniref:Uncharacterized protein n=1 Tax=Cystobacter fuscus (strain ATCC 25194 / DSM 2262 / NBRC 100088 / M29) TaxID=1242864 RepID=S9QD67_CYSF2|nr:hypothetical protein D187_003188 [Cystobacter fuscus DSM 2262]